MNRNSDGKIEMMSKEEWHKINQEWLKDLLCVHFENIEEEYTTDGQRCSNSNSEKYKFVTLRCKNDGVFEIEIVSKKMHLLTCVDEGGTGFPDIRVGYNVLQDKYYRGKVVEKHQVFVVKEEQENQTGKKIPKTTHKKELFYEGTADYVMAFVEKGVLLEDKNTYSSYKTIKYRNKKYSNCSCKVKLPKGVEKHYQTECIYDSEGVVRKGVVLKCMIITDTSTEKVEETLVADTKNCKFTLQHLKYKKIGEKCYITEHDVFENDGEQEWDSIIKNTKILSEISNDIQGLKKAPDVPYDKMNLGNHKKITYEVGDVNGNVLVKHSSDSKKTAKIYFDGNGRVTEIEYYDENKRWYKRINREYTNGVCTKRSIYVKDRYNCSISYERKGIPSEIIMKDTGDNIREKLMFKDGFIQSKCVYADGEEKFKYCYVYNNINRIKKITLEYKNQEFDLMTFEYSTDKITAVQQELNGCKTTFTIDPKDFDLKHAKVTYGCGKAMREMLFETEAIPYSEDEKLGEGKIGLISKQYVTVPKSRGKKVKKLTSLKVYYTNGKKKYNYYKIRKGEKTAPDIEALLADLKDCP